MVSFDDKPFQPRFLLQDLVFAHSEELGTPSIEGSLLHKTDWLAMSGVRQLRTKDFTNSVYLEEGSEGKRGP